VFCLNCEVTFYLWVVNFEYCNPILSLGVNQRFESQTQCVFFTFNFIILSSFINFSSTAFGKLHSYQLVILLLIIRSGAAHFFIKMIIWGKRFSCDPHNFDGDENLVPEFDGLLQDAQNFMGIFPREYESHVDLHVRIRFQYY